MGYKNSQHWKELKDSIISIALSEYHDSLPDGHSELDLVEEVMSDLGFFQDEATTPRPTLSIVAGQGKSSKRSKKSKLKICK